MRSLSILCLTIYLVPLPGYAQQIFLKNGDSLLTIQQNSAVAGAFTTSGASFSTQSVEASERFIIETDEMPKIISRNQNVSVAEGTSILKKNLFKEIEAINSTAKVGDEFTEVIQGFLFQGTSQDAERIRQLPHVKAVHRDLQISGIPMVPAAQPDASTSYFQRIATGKGVRVGVLDTGIDYFHDALGGGFGKTYKVAGGYDFVNNDPDPIDDNGHGTHVSGIIAGSSSALSGVAPDVSLYAYKVLDQNGNGYLTDVIKGIEQSIRDNVRILNLSLSASGGTETDLLSQAVDRAVEAGIVVICAAGNTSEYGSIGSPGAARNGLTVGAIDDQNRVATFSAKGPIITSYNIKPDVVAPGTGVVSAQLGGGYTAMNGTSMAAPMVTGIAAQICEQYPEWNAYQVRDAVIQKAKKISTIFTSGNGIPSPESISRIRLIASPAMVSFGFAVSSSTVWNASREITLRNTTPHTVEYSLSPDTPPGTSVLCSPGKVSIPSYGTQKVIVTVNANIAALPNKSQISDPYAGSILLLSKEDTVSIPFVFFKGNILRLEYDQLPWQTIIVSEDGSTKSLTPQSTSETVIIPPGRYDIITNFFFFHYVIKENVTLTSGTAVSIAKSEAKNRISIELIDELGKPIDLTKKKYLYSLIEGLFAGPTAVSYSMFGGTASASLVTERFISDCSSKYTFGYQATLIGDSHTTLTYRMSINTGISASSTIAFSPERMTSATMRYDVDTVMSRVIFPITWNTIKGKTAAMSMTMYDEHTPPLSYPFHQQTFYFDHLDGPLPIYQFKEAYKY